MKPRLRDDVHFVPRADGTFVVVPSRPDFGFSLGGDQTYEWLERIAPYLTGKHTLEELCRSLDHRRRTRVESLVDLLHREGAVRDATGDLPHGLSDEVRQTYGHVISFLSRSADSPEYRFQLYRECKLVVIGSGLLLGPLVQALQETGMARVRMVVTPERPTNVARIRECLALRRGRDAGQQLEVETREEMIEPSAAAAGAVLHVSDVPMMARARRLAQLCLGRRIIFGQAMIIGGRGLIGPVGCPGEAYSSWETCLWRLANGDVAAPFQDIAGRPVSEYLAGPTAAFVSNHLCVAFLKQVTGLLTEPAKHFVEVDLETLRVGLRAIAANPGSRRSGGATT